MPNDAITLFILAVPQADLEKDGYTVSVAQPPETSYAEDVAETTHIERPPRGREAVPVQLSRLLDAHQTIIRQTRKLARRAVELGDDGSNDLLVSEMLRTNELQVWFLSEHLVDVPLITATA